MKLMLASTFSLCSFLQRSDEENSVRTSSCKCFYSVIKSVSRCVAGIWLSFWVCLCLHIWLRRKVLLPLSSVQSRCSCVQTKREATLWSSALSRCWFLQKVWIWSSWILVVRVIRFECLQVITYGSVLIPYVNSRCKKSWKITKCLKF